MNTSWISTLGLILVVACGSALAAEQPRPPWLQPDVVKASVEIGMDEEQAALFRASVGRFLDGRMKALNRLLRGNNVTDLERKLKRKTRTLTKQMDEEMAEFLTDEQFPKYEVYRDTLMSHLQG